MNKKYNILNIYREEQRFKCTNWLLEIVKTKDFTRTNFYLWDPNRDFKWQGSIIHIHMEKKDDQSRNRWIC